MATEVVDGWSLDLLIESKGPWVVGPPTKNLMDYPDAALVCRREYPDTVCENMRQVMDSSSALSRCARCACQLTAHLGE